MSDEIKKKLYCAFVLVDKTTDVKECGAAIRYLKPDGEEVTQQAPMFRLEGTTDEILEQMTTRLVNGLALVEPVLIPKEKKSNLILP